MRNPRPYLGSQAPKCETPGLIWAGMDQDPEPQALSGPPRGKTPRWEQFVPTYVEVTQMLSDVKVMMLNRTTT